MTTNSTENTPTQRELEILKILWDIGPATVRDVYERMTAHEPLAQNTVQTFLRMMEDKGLVAHRAAGRAFVYRPLYTRQRTVSRFLHTVFDGAVDQLVLHAIADRKLSESECQRLEQLIHKARQNNPARETETEDKATKSTEDRRR